MTVSINAPDFIENFDVAEMTVGVIGFGYVGQAIDNFFNNQCRTVVYDKFVKVKDTYKLDTLEDVIKQSHYIFVAVPTPMNKDGSCHTGIIESVLDDIKVVATANGRDVNEFICVIKSTVSPGFTKRMQEDSGLRVVFSPEFLTEKNSFADMENVSRVLIGGADEDTIPVLKLYERKLIHKAVLGANDNPTALEMVKLFANTLMMTKVLIANEVYQVCQKLDIDYSEVMLLMCLDQRI
ncbi:MAG: NAD(P)-dependent oxidoreductase, partial [Candidatus Thorarchaeota archaeon]